MAEKNKKNGRRRWQPRIFRVVNVPMRWLLRLPFKTPLSRQLMLLSYRGRKSGKTYQQPVSYVPDGETLLTPGGGRWKRNLREDQSIRVHLRGEWAMARPELVSDPSEVERLLKQMAVANPRITSFVPVIGSDGEIDDEKLRTALAHGFCVIRWHMNGVTERGEERSAIRAEA